MGAAMDFNVVLDKWIPVKLSNGTKKVIAPNEISDENIVELDFVRNDFNQGCMELLIGLITTFYSEFVDKEDYDEKDSWEKLYKKPPSNIKEIFEKYKGCFWLVRDSVGENDFLFLQEKSIKVNDNNIVNVSNLLLTCASDNSKKTNTDFFNKRKNINICKSCAISSLYYKQENCPMGGCAVRASLKGGGAITVILSKEDNSLWKNIMLNVIPTGCNNKYELQTLVSKNSIDKIFPWMTNSPRISGKNSILTTIVDIDTEQNHTFWSMPRRILIKNNTTSCNCSICGILDDCFTEYSYDNYGVKYDKIQNKLTPYIQDKKTQELFPQTFKEEIYLINFYKVNNYNCKTYVSFDLKNIPSSDNVKISFMGYLPNKAESLVYNNYSINYIDCDSDTKNLIDEIIDLIDKNKKKYYAAANRYDENSKKKLEDCLNQQYVQYEKDYLIYEFYRLIDDFQSNLKTKKDSLDIWEKLLNETNSKIFEQIMLSEKFDLQKIVKIYKDVFIGEKK
jgi:hypothetical protein